MGATFAYFSVTGSGSSDTNITATTKGVPTITLSGSAGALSMELTAEDMKQGEDKSYWASAEGEKKLSQEDVEIAKITSTGGEATDNYECTLTVTITSSNAAELTALGEGNVNLYLTGLVSQEIDLSSATNYQTPITQKIDLKGTELEAKSLKAAFEIKNSSTDNQSSAAGKEIGVKIATSISGCALKTGE